MDLSIITVTYNARDMIAEQLRSAILGCGVPSNDGMGLSFEQIVVDNGSTDGTVELIRKEFPAVRIIPNSKNRGFGKANNQGVELAIGTFFLFLNPDMRVLQHPPAEPAGAPAPEPSGGRAPDREAGSLDYLVQWMRNHPDVGIAGCKLIKSDGSFNPDAGPRRFPRLWEMIATILKLSHFFSGLLNRYLMKGFDSEKEQEVDTVRGSFIFVRRELIGQLGWAFDPRYFIWFEDVDLCREAKRLGWKVVYTPIVSCIDYIGQTFKKQNFWWKQKRFAASAVKYFWKWKH